MQTARTGLAQRLKSERGFSTFEFVAASLILFVVLMGVLGAVEYAGAATRMAAVRQGAVDVATTQIEAARNLPWDKLGLYYANGWVGDPGGDVPATTTITTSRGKYTIANSITWARDSSGASIRASYKRVRVNVSWTAPTAGSVAIETNIFGKSITGNTGIVQVHARDVDNPSTVLSGINIVMTPSSGTNRVATTASDGVALWNDVPTGNATFPSPLTLNPNWLVDVGGLGTQTIVSGFKDIGFIDCQRPCTARIHVHSTSIANYQGAKVTLKDTDRNITYTAYTGADGYAEFSQAAGTVNGGAGLWKSKGAGYTAVATAGSATSNTGAFLISTSGQAYSGLDLAMPDPPSITITKRVSSTGVNLNGVAWSCTVRDPSNNVVGTYSGSDDSFTCAISALGTYTATITGVNGFLDTTAAQKVTTSASNIPFVVSMPPLYLIGVKLGSSPYAGAAVTLKNAVSGASALTTGGLTVGTTDANGTAGFVIPADGTYNIQATVNKQVYPASLDQVTLDAENPPTATHWITSIPASTITLTVICPTTTTWKRVVGVWDSNGTFVTQGWVTYASSLRPTITFTLPGGDYYVGAANSSVTSLLTSPYPIVPPTSSTVWSGMLASPWLPLPKSTIPTTTSGSLSVGPINVRS